VPTPTEQGSAGLSDDGQTALTRARTTSEHRFRLRVVAATVAVAAYLLWLLADLGGNESLVSDLVFVAAPLWAAFACWRAHRTQRSRHTGWLWLTAGCLTWAGGSVAWAVYELVLSRPSPFPSLADVGYVGYAVPVAVGVLKFPRSAGGLWSRRRLALDGAVIAGSLLLTSALWVLDPIVDATALTSTRVIALAYPIADVAVAAIVLARCMSMPDMRRLVWVPLFGGWLALALVDSVYVALTWTNDFDPGGPMDVGWLVAFVLVGLAASAPAASEVRERPTARVDASTVPPQLIPYAAVGLAVVACFTESAAVAQRHYWWLLLPVAVLVFVRQVVVVGDHVRLERSLADAVDRRTAELRHREQWWQDLVQNLSDVVMVVDVDGEIAYCSPVVGTALGHWPELMTSAELRTQVHPGDDVKVGKAIQPVLAGQESYGFVECRIRRSDNSYGWFEVTAVGQLDEQALEGAVVTLHDVTDRHELTTQLMHQAHHDSLTGLPNRSLLMQRIDEALAGPGERGFGLLLLDLDDFKVINDRHGHAAGDIVLEVIGHRLSSAVRTGDTVARLGGDEFAHLVHGSIEELRTVAERLVEQVGRPVVTGGRQFVVKASVGIVVAGDTEHESAQSLLSHADIALYEAKARDRGGVVLIEGAERKSAADQVHLREQIAQPTLDEFTVVYQPIVDLRTGRLRGVESLLRWHHPELGPVPPDVFIPMAEHGGSIQTLGWHVLEESCAQLARWQAEVGGTRLAVGVNASVRQLDEPDFAQTLLALIARHGIDPSQIVLELTEQALALDFETAVDVVADLRRGGVSVAVDDYGTGYSSLQYLHRFEADVVKIDRSFVANLVDSVHTQKIVRSVLHMAESLDLQSIAEGIETVEQLEQVRALGCQLGQGYLFSRPVTPDRISTLLVADEALSLPLEEASPWLADVL
jgi:diguanylate cyclase (GGDEF)-like protein/PAS domain S-box-containing protein